MLSNCCGAGASSRRIFIRRSICESVATSVEREDSVVIRQADRPDLLAIYRIEKQVFTQPWPYPAFEGFLTEPNFLVAVDNGTVCGYIVADTVPQAGVDLGHIKDLAVHPDAQRNGVGRQLLRRAVLGLSVENVARIKLEVRASNRPAQQLYRDEGFTPHKRIPNYYDDGETAIVLSKRPEPTADLGR